jgi:hypothetical protein
MKVHQILVSRGRPKNLPLKREYIYAEGESHAYR